MAAAARGCSKHKCMGIPVTRAIPQGASTLRLRWFKTRHIDLGNPTRRGYGPVVLRSAFRNVSEQFRRIKLSLLLCPAPPPSSEAFSPTPEGTPRFNIPQGLRDPSSPSSPSRHGVDCGLPSVPRVSQALLRVGDLVRTALGTLS